MESSVRNKQNSCQHAYVFLCLVSLHNSPRDDDMAFLPRTPSNLGAPFDTTLTPIFRPSPFHVLAIESYFGLGGPGFPAALLYNPLDPRLGLVVNDEGKIAPVLEDRWREVQDAVAGVRKEIELHGGGSWSRPQNVSPECALRR